MISEEILNLVFSQNGNLTKEQFENIYDYSPTLMCVFYNEEEEYKIEMWFIDKNESVFCNVM